MNTKRAARIFFMLLLAAALCGCAVRTQNVTNLPAGVTQAEVQAWDTEVADLQKVSTVVSTLRQAVIGAENAGAWPDSATYVKALQTVAKMDQLELAAAAFLQQQPQHFGVSVKQSIADYVNQIGSLMDSLSLQSVAGIKNPDTQKAIKAVVTELDAALQLALTAAQ